MKGKFIKSNRISHESQKRIAFVHHKGGTGKTTACLNIAGWLTKMQYKVLVIDLDPQANATTGLGIDINTVDGSIYDVLIGNVPIQEVILESDSGIYIAPADSDLMTIDHEINRNAFWLDEKLQNIDNQFQFILIDAPPGTTGLMANGIVASQNIIIPLDTGVFSYETLETLKKFILRLETEFEISINIMTGIIKLFSSSLMDKRLTQNIHDLVKDFFVSNGLQDCNIYTIPFSKKICEAQMYGLPISHYAPMSKVGKVFQHIAKTIVTA